MSAPRFQDCVTFCVLVLF